MALIPDTNPSPTLVVRYSGRDYFAHRTASDQIGIGVALVGPRYHRRHVVKPDEESAQRWLCENGLSKSQAKKLLAALKPSHNT